MAEEKLQLMDIPRGSKIFINPPLEVNDGSKYIIFDHPDGMYSYCLTEKGAVIHLALATPLIEVEGGYEIDRQK